MNSREKVICPEVRSNPPSLAPLPLLTALLSRVYRADDGQVSDLRRS